MAQPESLDAKKTAAVAMSEGCAMRPRGVVASTCLRKSLLGETYGVKAFGLDHTGVDGVDADLFWSEFAGEGDGDGVYGSLGGAVDGCGGDGHLADDRADVDDGSAVGADELDGFLGGEEEAEDVEVELLVEVLGCDGSDGLEVVDAGVVDEDVDLAVGLFGLGEELLDVFELGDVALDGDGLAAPWR